MSTKIVLDKPLARRWVAALRSGRYAQGQAFLRRSSAKGKTSFCCLGVLCDISARDNNDVGVWRRDTAARMPGELGYNYVYVGDDEDEDRRKGRGVKLWPYSSLNDLQEASFAAIAKRIEKDFNL